MSDWTITCRDCGDIGSASSDEVFSRLQAGDVYCPRCRKQLSMSKPLRPLTFLERLLVAWKPWRVKK